MQHYHTDIDQFRKMVVRALTALKADLDRGASLEEDVVAMSAPVEMEKKVALGTERREATAPRKGKPKKSESLAAWPEGESDEDVETFNIGKKS
jgi:hypothetical protein